jgi:hypothetical protein
MKLIVDKLKSLESDKLKFKEFLKETLFTHEPFEELNEIKEIITHRGENYLIINN